jgi:hypothetical protein
MDSEQVIRQPGESEHIVQLFDSSKSLAETVANFLWMALDRGDNVLIAATPQHTHLLTKRLEERGWSVRDAIAAKRMVVLDASATLGTFMRQDTPNAVAFDEVIGTAVRQLANRGRVWIYGEMVDVLAAKGNYKGAHALEELWNELGKRECFTLFCGYASGHFGDARHTRMLGEICKSHSHVHRKADDLLAEYLLEQPEVRAAATTPSAATFPSQP